MSAGASVMISKALPEAGGTPFRVAAHVAVGWRPQSLITHSSPEGCLSVFTTRGVASPRVSDARESKEEAAVSFMTQPGRSHCIISTASRGLLMSALFRVGGATQGHEFQEAGILGAMLETGCHEK